MIWSTRLLALAIFTAADWVENSDEDLVDLRLLQISNVLHLSDRTKITSLRPQPWNFTQILQDQPNGSFLSHLDVLVRMIGVTYNTTRPLSGVHQTPSTLTARDGSVWKRMANFDRDPVPGGVFARVFRNGAGTVVVVFKGVCTEAKVEQCQIDLCYLKEIQNYGAETGRVMELMGFDAQVCQNYRGFLNFTEQALALVTSVQTEFPRCQLLVTGHSLGGMLAMTVAQLRPQLKGLAFAPTPWKHVLGKPLEATSAQNDLISLCDPYDCGINAFFVPGARLAATTCLFLDQEEPKPCQGLVEPYINHSWRQQLEKESPSDFLIPLLLCKGSAHRWTRYESLVELAARTQKLPLCSRDFSVLQRRIST